MGKNSDDKARITEMADHAETLRAAMGAAKRIFGIENLTPDTVLGLHARVSCFESAKDQELTIDQIEDSAKLAREVFGELGKDPEVAFSIYDVCYDEGEEE